MIVLICSRTKSIFNLLSYWRFLLLTYLSKSCTTCLFISKSFKELFFKHFLFESGCKGKDYFWTTKTFSKFFFQKVFFEAVGSNSLTLFSISTHLRFSLESGCKITALRHILQIFTTLFSYFFAFVYLSRWFSKDAVQHILNTFGAGKGYRANIIYSI